MGSVAQHCVVDRCQDKICIPACCPAATLWQEVRADNEDESEHLIQESEACQPKEDYELQPPFVDRKQNPVSLEKLLRREFFFS